MKTLPLAILEPTLSAVISGRCTRLRRIADGALGKLQPGDRLWVREAYYLQAAFDSYKPTTALSRGAEPIFLYDHRRTPCPAGTGKKRDARSLCREWHRRHLVIEAVETIRLQAIADADIVAEGFRSQADWIGAWNRGGTICGRGRSWADNPIVIVFDFRHVGSPVPAADLPATGRFKPAEPPPSEAATPRPAVDRTPCPRCGVRRDVGCQHYPRALSGCERVRELA